MTIKSLPAPDPENDNGQPRGSRRRQAQGSQRAEVPLPDVDRLLQMLLQLNAAVLLGVISTETANVIHRNLRAVLDIQRQRDGRASADSCPESLIQLCRGEPQLLNSLEPFLSDAQFEWLVERATESDDELV